MHPFWLIRKFVEHVPAPSQSNADFLRLSEPTVVQGFSLACIGEMVTAPASEKLTDAVKQRHATPPGDGRSLSHTET